MNKKSFFRLAMMASIVSVIVISCAKDTGNDVVTLPRDKFIGTWHVTSHHTDPGVAPIEYWDLIIDPASASAAEQIVMKNMDQSGTDQTVYADVSGNNLLIPATHVHPGGGDVTIEGTGNLNGATLTLAYTSQEGAVTDTVTATATK
jgi:hypothetical protein